MGYPSSGNRTRTEALNNVNFGPDIDAVWTYNAETQLWEEVTISDNFIVGRGYWIHSLVAKTWQVPW